MGSIPEQTRKEYDALIIGAGLSGLYSVYQLRKQFPSWRVGAIEAASDVGGTWHWNGYPGCRVDIESIAYCFSFDKELLQEWDWKESFASQPEMQRYTQRFAEKHDLYKDIKFNTRVKSARWNDNERKWTFVDDAGNEYVTRFFISCVGILSEPTLPAIPGIENFRGESFHSSRWPKDFDVNTAFVGKRIGIIGTGATGIQATTAISKIPGVKSLTVFQRTANWSAPLRNEEMDDEEMTKHKTNYDSIFQQCSKSPFGVTHLSDPRKSADVPHEERVELWEKMYAQPGFGKWLSVFCDTYTDRQANELYSKFMADKIRARVNDPEVADSLIPKTHGFGLRRLPLESGYFEAFNQPNVHLVDLRKTPISQVTESSITTSDGKDHELDILIYCTGFDAITGAFNAIEWHAKDDRPLIAISDSKDGQRAIWVDHRPQTFLGYTAPSMPNTFIVLGPHQPFGNIIRSVEYVVQVVSDLLQFCQDNNYTYVEPTQEAVDAWTTHVVECSKGALMNDVDSWTTGINTNVKGKTVRSVARYTGGSILYRKRCEECKAKGYKEFIFA